MLGNAGHTDTADSRTFGFPKSQTFCTHHGLLSASTASLSRANSGAVTLSSGTSKAVHLRILVIDGADSISEED